MIKNIGFLFITFILFLMPSCQAVDNERIPNMAVNITFADAGVWNTYGVAGFGIHRNFIINPNGINQPSGFTYRYGSATGFGGVLLIGGMDPYSAVTEVPLAYDLACPVERKQDVRVYIDNETYVAVCSQCKSTYDVTMGGGAPISGEAATGKYKYALKRYRCLPNGSGGYNITN